MLHVAGSSTGNMNRVTAMVDVSHGEFPRTNIGAVSDVHSDVCYRFSFSSLSKWSEASKGVMSVKNRCCREVPVAIRTQG